MKWLGSTASEMLCYSTVDVNDDRKNFYFPYIYFSCFWLDVDVDSDLTQKTRKKEHTNRTFYFIQRILQACFFPYSRIQNFIQPLALKWNICLGEQSSKSSPNWTIQKYTQRVDGFFPPHGMECVGCCSRFLEGIIWGKVNFRQRRRFIPFLQERTIFFFCFLFIGCIVVSHLVVYMLEMQIEIWILYRWSGYVVSYSLVYTIQYILCLPSNHRNDLTDLERKRIL